jgi:hypothetical protein
VNSNDKTIHPSVQLTIIVTPATGRPGAFAARLEGDSTVLVTSRAPFLASARKLIAAGYPRDAMFMMRHEGAKEFALKARLGKAAKLTVEESAHGPVFRTVRDGPPSSVAGSQAPVAESSLGEPRLEAPAEPLVEAVKKTFGQGSRSAAEVASNAQPECRRDPRPLKRGAGRRPNRWHGKAPSCLSRRAHEVRWTRQAMGNGSCRWGGRMTRLHNPTGRSTEESRRLPQYHWVMKLGSWQSLSASVRGNLPRDGISQCVPGSNTDACRISERKPTTSRGGRPK